MLYCTSKFGSAFEMEIYDSNAERLLTVNMQTTNAWALKIFLFYQCSSSSGVVVGGGSLCVCVPVV